MSSIKKPRIDDLNSDDEDGELAKKEKERTSLSDIEKICLVGPKIKKEAVDCIDL